MIIDFHTHVFPDRIAAATIEKLESFTPHARAHTDGTLSGLVSSMKEAGVDYSVVLPVVTNPKQFDGINGFAAEHNVGNLIFFGGIHPDCDGLEERVDKIKSLGLRGIKLHPDYQSVFVDDERYIRIIRRALENDMFVTLHAGVDIGMPEPVHCPPELSARMLDAVDDLNRGEPRIIFAHLGGNAMADDVLKYLCGRNCVFDTGFSLISESPEKTVEIIRTHGAERILFATDSPWQGQAESVKFLSELPLTSEEKDKILGENAARLLGIK